MDVEALLISLKLCFRYNNVFASLILFSFSCLFYKGIEVNFVGKLTLVTFQVLSAFLPPNQNFVEMIK